MDAHSNSQCKTQVDAEVLSKGSLPCHHLGYRPQAKRLVPEKQ